MNRSFQQALDSGEVLVCDGAMGTMLQNTPVEQPVAPELFNLQHPEILLDIQRRYVAAGADIIHSNSFGGNLLKLRRVGIEDQIEAINREGVRLALEAAAGKAFVAGDLGPTGELLEPYGDISIEDATAAYEAQAKHLAAGGVQLFLIETLSDLNEAKAAIDGVRRVSDLPVICTLSYGAGGRTMMGTTPQQAAEFLSQLPVQGIGVNCGQGPEGMFPIVEALVQYYPGGVVVVQPNAGLPTLVDGVATYDASPATLAEWAVKYVAAGARRRSTPEHTAAIAKAVAGR